MNPHSAHPTSFAALLRSTAVNRQLILQLVRRDVIGRYRGSIGGIAWSFLNPLLMLAIYTVVFSGIFKQVWPGMPGRGTTSGFAIMLFVGLITHALFAECVTRAPGLVLANPNYVKRVIFPLEILPIVSMGSAMFHSLISLGVLIAAQLVVYRSLPWTASLLPVIVLPLILTTLGIAWFLAALGVFVRDISQITTLIVSIAMFLSPVFYPASQIPERFKMLFYLNPLTYPIEDARGALIFGLVPEPGHIVIELLAGLIVAQVGFWWFQKTRRGFADVI